MGGSHPRRWRWCLTVAPAACRSQGIRRFAGKEANAGHAAIAELANRFPGVRVVTQNVDGLHGRSGVPHHQLIEVHGNADFFKCVSPGCRFSTNGWIAKHDGCRVSEAAPSTIDEVVRFFFLISFVAPLLASTLYAVGEKGARAVPSSASVHVQLRGHGQGPLRVGP